MSSQLEVAVLKPIAVLAAAGVGVVCFAEVLVLVAALGSVGLVWGGVAASVLIVLASGTLAVRHLRTARTPG